MSTKPKTVQVDLEFPIEHDNRVITSLTFRRMKAKDALIAEGIGEEGDPKAQAQAGYLLFAALADVDVEVIEELDIEDMAKVAEKVGDFLGNSAAALAAAKRAIQPTP